MNLSGKRLLVLGGKPIGSCDMVDFARRCGAHVIVADYLPPEQSPAKQLADESWILSTADVPALAAKCRDAGVDGVVTGVHEFNIKRWLELCAELRLPTYCTRRQWDILDNKASFKKACSEFGIPVAKVYDGAGDAEYPVIVKPTDSSGSRGFSICRNDAELAAGVEKALAASDEGRYLIEEFVDSSACIVHYTAVDGDIRFSGMSDKISLSLDGGSRVMALQTFPSRHVARYLDELDAKAVAMLKSVGVANGPVWIEVFNDTKTGRMLFNEAGYRFGGSMTNHVVRHFYGVDQMAGILSCALAVRQENPFPEGFVPEEPCYCILPMHLRPGRISAVRGLAEAEALKGVKAIVPVHFEGDLIENWGTTRQVFCYLHVAYDTPERLKQTVDDVLGALAVEDDGGRNLLYTLFDTDKLIEAAR